MPPHSLHDNYFHCLLAEFPLLPFVFPIVIYSPCPTLEILLSDDLVSYKMTYLQHRYSAHIVLGKKVSVSNSAPAVPFCSTGRQKTSLRSLCRCISQKPMFLALMSCNCLKSRLPPKVYSVTEPVDCCVALRSRSLCKLMAGLTGPKTQVHTTGQLAGGLNGGATMLLKPSCIKSFRSKYGPGLETNSRGQ